MKQLTKLTIFFVLSIALLPLTSCKREYSCEGCRENNIAPIAIAGPDQAINLPSDSTILDGTASNDPDGTITSYQWTKIAGPGSSTIANSRSAKTTVKQLSIGTYRFELSVKDNGGLTSRDTLQIAVSDLSISNKPPIANAGADQTLILSANPVVLDGSLSTDPDNNIVSYTWTKVSGPVQFDIANPNNVKAQATKLVVGVYDFELKVTDAGGLFSKDTVRISLNSPTTIIACDGLPRPIINASMREVGTLSYRGFGFISASVGNKIFFAGRWTDPANSRVDIYDISTNTTSIAELSLARHAITTVSCGSKVFFAGGGEPDAGTAISRVDIYDVNNNNWSIAELSKARMDITSVSLGNKVFFAGGIEAGGRISSEIDIYDNLTNTWSVAELSEARWQLSATAVGNKVYFAGGYSGSAPDNISNRIDVYDIVTNSWTTSYMHEPKMGMGSIAVGDKIFWPAGTSKWLSTGYVESDLVEIRDVSTGSSAFNCISPRSYFSSVLKNDNIIFFTGNSKTPEQFDIYNLSSGKWSIGVMPFGLNFAGIISVNNTVYVAGGSSATGNLDKIWKLEF